MASLWERVIPYNEGELDFVPSITAYPAESKGAVVVFAGGGYAMKAAHEGPAMGEWLQKNGITAFVVDYRVAPYKHPAQISDAMRAVRYVRFYAEKYGIDRDKIAVMGFSAGGHLAASLGNLYEQGLFEDGEDRNVSSRPDWMLLCYPVITFEPPFANSYSGEMLMGTKTPAPELARLLSCEQNVTKNTPPAFIWHTYEDNAVPVENSLMYAAALRRNGIPFELHIYEKGAHGTGLFDGHPWAEEAVRWMDKL